MIRRVAALLLALGLVGGVVFDRAAPRPVVRRGPWRVLEADFHAHTSLSDGSLSPFGLVRQADRRGLDVLGVTEHNTVWAAEAARLYARIFGGPTIVIGEEITTARFHVVALGLDHTVTPDGRELDAILDDVHAQHAVAIAAHPVTRYWPSLLPVRAKLDGSEVMHPIAYSTPLPTWRWADMQSFYREADPPLAAIGSSDYHWGTHLGWCRTLVFAERDDAAAVVDAVRAHRTVVYDRDGTPWSSDPSLLALLAKEPYTPRAIDYSYRGASVADRLLRVIGWLGVVLLVTFERRKRIVDDGARAVH